MGCVVSNTQSNHKGQKITKESPGTNLYFDQTKSNNIIIEEVQATNIEHNKQSKYNAYYAYGRNCKSKILFTDDGNLIYSVAAMGIILDPSTNRQTIFGADLISNKKQHDNEIWCINLSKDRDKVITGQRGPNPKVFIWSSSTASFISKYEILGDSQGITVCTLSIDDKFLAFISKEDKDVLHLIDRTDGKLLWKKLIEQVLSIEWGSNKNFITCSNNDIMFWSTDNKESNTIKELKDPSICCVGSDGKGMYYGGGVYGSICLFMQCSFIRRINHIHNGKVTVILVRDEKVVSAGEDKKVVVRSKDAEITLYMFTYKSIPNTVDIMGDCLVVGDDKGEITLYQNTRETANWINNYKVKAFTIANNFLITINEENIIIIWDYYQCKAVIAAKLNALEDGEYNNICYNKKTEELAIGLSSGGVYIKDFKNIAGNKKILRDSNMSIESIKYSPSGSTLAVGGKDTILYIYAVPSYKLIKSFTVHSSPIVTLDWTSDDVYVCSLGEDGELIYWDIEKQEQDKEANTKTLQWNTNTCTLRASMKSSSINDVVKSKEGKLIAVSESVVKVLSSGVEEVSLR